MNYKQCDSCANWNASTDGCKIVGKCEYSRLSEKTRRKREFIRDLTGKKIYTDGLDEIT